MVAEARERADQELLRGHGAAEVERGLPGREHRQVVVVEILDRLRVVCLELVVGNLVDPGVHHPPEQLASGLPSDRLGDDADGLLRFYEAERHPVFVSGWFAGS